MDASTIIDAITNVGFPVVMVFVFLYAIKYILDTYCKKIDDQTDKINSLEEDIKEVRDEVKIAIDNNTQAMENLKETFTLFISNK